MCRCRDLLSLSAVLVEQGSCGLVLPLAEESFVQTCVKSAKGPNQKLEGVVTAGAPH